MKHSSRWHLVGSAVLAIGATTLPAPTAQAASAYDIDCKLILCLAGGFPAGCADAFEHMIDRITSVPPKSPIGLCLMSDGTPYDNYDVDYGWLSATSPEAFSCPEDKQLHHEVRNEDYRTEVRAFCYTSSISYGAGDDGTTVYFGKSAPERHTLRTHIVVEPGTDAAYSPGWQQWDTGARYGGGVVNVITY